MPGHNLTRAEATGRAALLEVDAYEVELDLTDGGGKPGSGTFRSRTTVQFGCRQPGADTFIELVADTLHRARLNGRELDVAAFADRILPLPALAADNTLVVDADCAYTNTGEGLHRFVDPVDGEVYLYSQFETADAKRVYACFDQPDLKAVFRLTVTAPAHWQVVSNAPVEESHDGPGGARVQRFGESPPMSPYITALVAGPFHVVRTEHDGIDLAIYCRASLAEHLDADALFEVTSQGFDFYHREFDYRYPFGKYDQLFVPEFNAGAMENAGAVTFHEDYIFRSRETDAKYERRAETILHEMAHMWFGDLVTMRWWDDLWLNESFATFASVLCQARATRWTGAWTTFCNSEKTWAYRQDQLPSTHPVACDIPDVAAVEVNFDGITYAKGASVLKQLVAWVGLDAFMQAMRGYFAQHALGNATLADLLGALEKASGRDLSGWSDEWLETAGVNTLQAEFELDAERRFTSFEIVQSAPADYPTLRSHRLTVGCYDLVDSRLTRTHQVSLDVTGERTAVADLVGRPRPAVVLLNDGDLTYAKIRLDQESSAVVTEHVADFADSLPRALCWAAAWDMTRDAGLTTRDYLTMVLGGIGREADIGVVGQLLRHVQTALSMYATPAWEATGRELMARSAHDHLHAAGPGSDHQQLTWARAFAAAARSSADLAEVQALLDGSATVDGLRVDTDLRWHLLQCLVAVGAAGDAEIEAEEQRDPTAAGQRSAATARTLRPTAEAKAEAWRLATDDDTIPNAVTSAIVSGFYHPDQRAITEPYIDRYHEDAPKVWERRSSEIAQFVAIGLYPALHVGTGTVAATHRLAGDPNLPPPLRRLLLENADGVERALRARARDAVQPPGAV